MNKRLVILIGAVLIVCAAGGIVGMKLMSPAKKKTHVVKVVEPKPVMVPLNEFLVNLADSDGEHFLRTQIVLSVKGKPGNEALIKGSDPKVRDAIIGIMTRQRFNQLQTPQGKQVLKVSIEKAVNQVLEKDIVTDVYFTSFAMQ